MNGQMTIPTISKVDATLALLRSCLGFRVQLERQEAAEVLTRFDPYNDIPNNIATLPGAILDSTPTLNGRVYVGNECSLVIYYEGSAFDAAAVIEAGYQLKRLSRRYHADEFSHEIREHRGLHMIEARFWWD